MPRDVANQRRSADDLAEIVGPVCVGENPKRLLGRCDEIVQVPHNAFLQAIKKRMRELAAEHKL
jgi:hypothetical protein